MEGENLVPAVAAGFAAGKITGGNRLFGRNAREPRQSEVRRVKSANETTRGGWGLGRLDIGSFMRRVANVLDFRGKESASGPSRRTGTALEEIRAKCLEAVEKNGKLAGLVAVAEVADAYSGLEETERGGFFKMLHEDFSVDPQALDAAIAAYQTARDPGSDDGGVEPEGADVAKALVKLTRTLESPRHVLFRQFNTIPSGIKFLVDLRADLYPFLKRDPSLAPLEYELRRLLEAFFNLGFLRLERIGWESPAVLLENLVRYEAVHRISNWVDLKHRLVSDRACFAFIHPSLPTEPVIFVEVALTRGIADNIQRLLDPEAPDLSPDQADTAIFYGISNAQSGLRGIPFGNLLIKQVATRLKAEVPNLETFATLSPLPNFRKDFLDPAVADGSIAGFYTLAECKVLCELAGVDTVSWAVEQVLSSPGWETDGEKTDALRAGLMRAARHYLTDERENGRAVCPVAHFHGSNGALLARIDWLADTSETGIAQSAGLMVNYLYDMENFEQHQNGYLQNGALSMAKAVEAL